MTAVTRTTCPYCGVGCGVLVTRSTEGIQVEGDPDHPANRGKLCSKGLALAETLAPDNRLLAPTVRGAATTWATALDFVAQEFNRIIAAHGRDAVAFYVSGQLLTEDYYVANKLMKGYIGSANIDTNSRLCMSSAVAGHKRAFGEDLVPVGYEDLECADLVVLVGSNTAWCHPVMFQRLVAAKAARPEMKIVVIDPRRTATCEYADLHLPLRAGTDVWLFNGLLAFLNQRGVVDTRFVAEHTEDAGRALLVAENTAGDVAAVAKVCGVDPQLLREFYSLFALTPKVVTAFSQGVNQSSSGTDKVNSIINCHLLTGRIGKSGMGPFSITGQPNAMGGREVGGMANMLAAHMDLGDAGHRRIVQEFWNSPHIADQPGLKAVDLFEAMHSGRIKAVWIMATNPVVSMPDADRVREALQRCELVVVSDCVANTDTAALAHVLLPATGWAEKDGTVTNSVRTISRQRAFLPATGLARHDWWIVSQVAQRMGFAGFEFQSPREVFLEHAQLSATGNGGTRAFNLEGVAGINDDQYNTLAPFTWPRLLVDAAGATGAVDAAAPPLFADGRYYHADGRARFVATTPAPPEHARDTEYPFVLNTGRIRDQWHTMTRTGISPRLSAHLPEPYVDLHPQDALLNGMRVGQLARVSTAWGSVVMRVRTSGEIARGNLFVPIHWNDNNASDARIGAMVNPVVDPFSGQPELKHTPARIEPFVVSWFGFAISRSPLDLHDIAWWSRAQGPQFSRYELAGRRVHGDRSAWARRLLGAATPEADWLDYADPYGGTYRAALLDNNRLTACLFVASRPELPARSWLAALFAKDRIDDADRASLLAGASADPAADTGAIVCSCFGVGRKTISNAITRHGCTTPQAIGQKLKAGTNCGSCIPELKVMLAELDTAAMA